MLQAIAPGRFAAALNQAPMDVVTGIFPDERLEAMRYAGTLLDTSFAWPRPPILNDWTRLAFIADAETGDGGSLNLLLRGAGPPPFGDTSGHTRHFFLARSVSKF